MKKTVLTICLLSLFSGQVFAESIEKYTADNIEKYTADNIEINQEKADKNNRELIRLFRKNSQQAFMITELQKRLMRLEYNLKNINARLKNIEAETYKKNMQY